MTSIDQPTTGLDAVLGPALAGAEAEVVRAATRAFALAVYEIVLTRPDDPTVRALHEQLQRVLIPGATARPTPRPRAARAAEAPTVPIAPPPPRAISPEDVLWRLVDGVHDEHRMWLGSHSAPHGPSAVAWEWLHLQSWRIPGPDRDVLLRQLAELGGADLTGHDRVSAATGPPLLVPRSTLFEHEGRWAADAAAASFAGSTPEVLRIAGILDELLTVGMSFVELRNVFRSEKADRATGSSEFESSYGKYVVGMAQVNEHADPLDMAVRLHEGVASLCPWPLPSPASRWCALVREATALVTDMAETAGTRLWLLNDNDECPRIAKVEQVSIFGPTEQAYVRRWQLRIGVVAASEDRRAIRLLEVKGS